MPQPCAKHRVWVDDTTAFSTGEIGRLRHDFHEHPLLQLAELERLAHDLAPLGQCRFVRPGITQASAFVHADTHPGGLGIGEVFRRIEEAGSWVALYNVEAVPRYRALLSEILDTVRPLIEREQGPAFMETGFIFVSAPPSVTPFHIDRENNFWLQLRGRKTLSVWPHTDRTAVPAEVVEDFIVAHATRGVRFSEELRSRSRDFDVGPGDGVYFPSTTPHATRSERDWVRPGDGVSVSFGVNFYTAATRRTARVHQVNRLLRRGFGLAPTFPGESHTADALKAPIGRLIGASRQVGRKVVAPLLRRSVAPPPPGSY